MLNSTRRSYRETFLEELENQLNIYNVENDLDRMEISCSHDEIEVIDELIIRIFQVATRKVEGMKRLIPFSHEKEKQ